MRAWFAAGRKFSHRRGAFLILSVITAMSAMAPALQSQYLRTLRNGFWRSKSFDEVVTMAPVRFILVLIAVGQLVLGCGNVEPDASTLQSEFGVYTEKNYLPGQCAWNEENLTPVGGPVRRKSFWNCPVLDNAETRVLFLENPQMPVRIVATFRFKGVPMDHRYFGYHQNQRPQLPRIVSWHMGIYGANGGHIFRMVESAPYAQFPAYEQYNDTVWHSLTQVVEVTKTASQLNSVSPIFVNALSTAQEVEIESLNVRVLRPF